MVGFFFFFFFNQSFGGLVVVMAVGGYGWVGFMVWFWPKVPICGGYGWQWWL